ncbi:phosphodiesterase, partial [Actinomadura sp. DSM 109109]|nr:phosphodiesterase [Actinomadura lepetitiana]
HPEGLVFDAALVLRGTSCYWGVPFLDDRTELRGEVRLSRAVGQPPTGDAEVPSSPELLLATTGRTRLGRHLLRPARHWSPAF